MRATCPWQSSHSQEKWDTLITYCKHQLCLEVLLSLNVVLFYINMKIVVWMAAFCLNNAFPTIWSSCWVDFPALVQSENFKCSRHMPKQEKLLCLEEKRCSGNMHIDLLHNAHISNIYIYKHVKPSSIWAYIRSPYYCKTKFYEFIQYLLRQVEQFQANISQITK